ncbi:MAG: hypothetical protein BWY34_00512 [Parcubacteria group bacterium ADurb.Bin247]|nr:MAG: hypothetical protein BWY34_00512 [Parcubacteria group bacterium ADurb.Bin247]
MILEYTKQEQLLKKYNLKTVLSFFIKNKKDALQAANKIGYPVVFKIFSQNCLHRTDIGGVITKIDNAKKAKEAFDKLNSIKGIDGIIVQKQIDGLEFIVGAKQDSVFGPVVMFGAGGVLVELFNDVSFRLAPFNRRVALSMIDELRSKKLLDGFRGGPNIKKEAVADLLVNTSLLASKENFKEIDFNPVIANEKDLFICDVKIIQ